MASSIYSAIASLDGYVADEQGNFDWAAPDEELHAFVNELERPIGTYLYGRRMYETMVVWETMAVEDEPPVVRDYAEIWRAADKIVYLADAAGAGAAPGRESSESFDPEAVRQLKAAADRDLGIGGAELAAQALDAGLVDELHLFLVPVLVGGGTRALSQTARAELELLDERRFRGGSVYLAYRVKP